MRAAWSHSWDLKGQECVMSFRNDGIPRGTVALVASTGAVSFVGFVVLAAGDVTYEDAAGGTTTATFPAGVTITCQIVRVTACTATALGYKA
jgi:hypothetical protein